MSWRGVCAAVCGAACLAAECGPADDWPSFRGPHGDGVCVESGVPSQWGRAQNLRWSVELPTPGNGSPIVSGGRVFLAGASRDGRERSLLAFDRLDGQLLWTRTVEFDAVEQTHETNPYGAVTPATDGKRVVVWHGSAGMFCYDLDGELLWSRDLGRFHHIWGYASSPVVYENRVFQLCGPGERQFLVALSLESGDVLWELQEPGGSASDNGAYIGSWATPVITRDGDRSLVVCGLPTRVAACDPENGDVLWSVSGIAGERHHLMYTTPLLGPEIGVGLGGFGGPAIGFRVGGRGDVTATHRLWRDSGKPKNPQRIGSGVLLGDAFYIANADNEGSIECRAVADGRLRWQVKRTNDGPHWGSLLLAEGRLYATGQKGVTRVFAANPDRYEEIAVNDLGEHTNATPAISNGELFIRTWERLHCISAAGRPD